MASFSNPSEIFYNALAAANKNGDDFVAAKRANEAFNALKAVYGPEVGDIKLATDAQAYGFKQQQNPLLLQQQEQLNAGTAEENRHNALLNPMLESQQGITNDQSALNLQQDKTLDERATRDDADAQRLKRAGELHATLGTALSTLGTQLQGVVDPEQRGTLFDAQVQRLAPLVGADPAALAQQLAPYRDQVMQNGAAAIPGIQSELDAAISGSGTEKDKVALEIAKQNLEQEKLTTQAAKDKATDAAKEMDKGVDQAASKLKKSLADIDAAVDLIPKMGDLALVRKGASAFPGTTEYNFMAKLKSATVEGGLQALQALSAAGVSLSPMSDTDFQALINSVANLDVGQDRDQLLTQVKNLRAQTQQALDIIEGKKGGAKKAVDAADKATSPDGKTFTYNPATGELE